MRAILLTYTLTLQLTVFALVNSCYIGIPSIGKSRGGEDLQVLDETSKRWIFSVSPMGDIIKEVGSTILINCTLKEDYSGPANSSNIKWRRNETVIDEVNISVLDIRTAQLRIDNSTTEDSGFYSCYVDIDEQYTVCNNDVRIGFPPAGGVDISCLSLNWENMTCTWSPPYNPVRTNWTFYSRMSKVSSKCPQYLNNQSGCFFSDRTIPPYRQAAKNQYFYLIGKNELGVNRTDYRFMHFEEVLPNPPSEVRAIEVNSQNLQLRWRPPTGMALFPPMLYYRLRYNSLWNVTWTNVDVGLNVTNYTIGGLLANTNYTIEVYCRSGASIGSPWSGAALTYKSTPVDVPSGKINITYNSFRQQTTISNRELTLYWEDLPRIKWNANNVSYMIDALEDGLQRNVTVVDQGHTSALVTNLELEKSYDFRIRARNEKGLSPSVARISVSPASQVLPVPDHVTVISFDNGIYEVSWTPAGLVDNFTVFWCDAQRLRVGHHCSNSSIKWMTLADVSSVTLTLSNEASYQFSVAANKGPFSSGMVWATCIVPSSGPIGKMKFVSVVGVTSTEITLTWRLECSEQFGILVGFSIYYCAFDNNTLECAENETLREYLNDPHASQLTLTNLHPFTIYKIMISATTRAGEGEPSNPMFNVTEEGVPGDTCILGLSSISNTSLVVAVQLPRIPNGIVRHLHFYVNGRFWSQVPAMEDREYLLSPLTCYTNYSVQVIACTKPNKCSLRSPPLNVTTDIGIPGPPNLVNIKLVNTSHVRVDWEDPEYPNGPILGWVVAFSWWDDVSHLAMVYEVPFLEDGNRVRFMALPVSCADENELPGPEYNVTVRAQTDMMDGTPSKTALQPCRVRTAEVLPMWLIAVIVVASLFALIVVICILVRGLHRLKKKVREMQNIKVQLPKGFESSNMLSLSGYDEFKSQLNGSSAKQNLLSSRLNSCDSDGKMNDGDPRFSASSIDELLSNMKCPPGENSRRNLSGDSSGCSSCGPESVSSSVTVRTHLSVDSGTEMEAPLTPDSVFTEPPSWKTASISTGRHRNLGLPKLDEMSTMYACIDVKDVEEPLNTDPPRVPIFNQPNHKLTDIPMYACVVPANKPCKDVEADDDDDDYLTAIRPPPPPLPPRKDQRNPLPPPRNTGYSMIGMSRASLDHQLGNPSPETTVLNEDSGHHGASTFPRPSSSDKKTRVGGSPSALYSCLGAQKDCGTDGKGGYIPLDTVMNPSTASPTCWWPLLNDNNSSHDYVPRTRTRSPDKAVLPMPSTSYPKTYV